MSLFTKRIQERHEAQLRKTGFLKFIEGLFFGVSIGTLIGLLIAPQSGKDTITDMRSKSEAIKDDVVDKGREIIPKIKEKVNKHKIAMEEDVEEITEDLKDAAEDVKEEL